MKKKWIAWLLAATMLLPTAAGLIACNSQTDPSDTPIEDSVDSIQEPLTSARAVDKGDMTYYLDTDGALYVSYTDHTTKLAELSATQICVSGNTLWYASGNTLCTYDLLSGKTAVYAKQEAEITTFALCGKEVYYLCADRLLRGDDLLIDLSARKAPDGTALSAVCDFELHEADQILLYLPNPHYQDEDVVPGYLLNEHNDTYVTYAYTISADLLEHYDYYAEQDGSTMASSSAGITINGISLPFSDYPVNSYFTQNGMACTCHDAGGCIANTKAGENCIRYWPNKANKQVDLCGVQCMGFARFCQWRLFGSHDYQNSTDFYNALGSKLAAGNWTANTLRTVLLDVGAGGHIRSGAGHSLFVISVTSTGFITYECNTSKKDCKVYTRQWTWDSFYAAWGSRELLYYNMPRNFEGGEVIPEENYQVGSYQITANGGLNMRAEPNTTSSVLVTIPNYTIVQVTAVQKTGNYYWGYTNYEGKSGWIRLDYAMYQSASISSIEITSKPNKTTYTVGDSFSTAGMVVQARFSDGTAFEIAGYTCSGYNMNQAGTYTVKVAYGAFSDSFTITVKEKNIPPTSLTLERSELTLIVGDTYEMSYTLLPVDTTQKTVVWTSNNTTAVTVSDGNIKAAAEGSATIVAATQNGITAVCNVTVIKMPTGTNWSATAEGQPLTALPIGIEPVDYSIRYRVPAGNGWSEWIYGNIPANLTKYQCQFRSFTATFVNTLDGQTVDLFTVEFNQVINLGHHTLVREGYLFTGWYYDPRSAESHDVSGAAPSKITVTEDLILYAGWIALDPITRDSTDPFGEGMTVSEFEFAGTELRVAGDATGIRFLGRISTSLIAELEAVHSYNRSFQPSKATDTGIGFGMVVRMRGSANTQIVKSDAAYLYKGGTVTVPAQRTYASYNGYILFNAFVCGYTSDYYKTDFAARPYLTYSDANGILHTYYFTVTGENAHGGGYCTNLYAEAEKMAGAEGVDPITKKWLEDTILN
ncbi:MAG: bacterial Ig-like domain-containing protein [Clostridia bacterium]|nr:bacterial Ig-like domain-containing protein [Clostridia bacterium]